MDDGDAELYTKDADELIRFASTLVGPSLAEDVMVTGVLSAFGARSWPIVTERRAYLYRSVLNAARQAQRSDRRRVLREAAVAPAAVSADTSVRLEVLDAMRRLSVRQRSVVFLTYWHEMSAADTARTLGLSVRTTERALHTARRSLQEALR